jgi:hypothetical protein
VPRPKAFARSDAERREFVTIRRAVPVDGPVLDRRPPDGTDHGTEMLDKQATNVASEGSSVLDPTSPGDTNHERATFDKQATKVASSLNKKLMELGVSEAAREVAERQVRQAIQACNARLIADSQERPAKIVAALKPGLKSANELRKWLDSLPQGVRLELRVGGLEDLLVELLERIENRMGYWRKHVDAHRPAGEGDARLFLRRCLIEILQEHLPDRLDATNDQKRANERRRLLRVAKALADAAIKFPNQRKNRKKFTGIIKS